MITLLVVVLAAAIGSFAASRCGNAKGPILPSRKVLYLGEPALDAPDGSD